MIIIFLLLLSNSCGNPWGSYIPECGSGDIDTSLVKIHLTRTTIFTGERQGMGYGGPSVRFSMEFLNRDTNDILIPKGSYFLDEGTELIKRDTFYVIYDSVLKKGQRLNHSISYVTPLPVNVRDLSDIKAFFTKASRPCFTYFSTEKRATQFPKVFQGSVPVQYTKDFKVEVN